MDTHDPAWEALRDLPASSIKVLLTLYRRENLGLRRTVNEVAEDAKLDRTTVMKHIHELDARGYVTFTLTARGKELASLIVDTLAASPAMSIMSTTDGAWSEIPTGEAGLTGEKPTERGHNPTANRSQFPTAHAQTAMQNVNQPNQDQRSAWPTDIQRRASELATYSAHKLDDIHSKGYHILVWCTALHADAEAGNHICEGAIMTRLGDLLRRTYDNPAAIRRAWTATTKQMFAGWGIPLNLKGNQPENQKATEERKPR